MPPSPRRARRSTLVPEPFSNVVVSTVEDVATGGLLVLAFANPVAALVIAIDAVGAGDMGAVGGLPGVPARVSEAAPDLLYGGARTTGAD